MPKGFNSKGYKTGGATATISCKECGKRFNGNQSKAKSLYLSTPKLITLNKYRKFLTNWKPEPKPKTMIKKCQLESMVPTNTTNYPKNSFWKVC